MLQLTSDRLDYGQSLRAPTGYRLDIGIATTFSLDLEALVAASLALTLDQTLEDAVSKEGIAFLESLDQLQGRLAVYYQRGNVKIPEKFNRLFAMLEPLLAPAASVEGKNGAFASFHPKIWLLRFTASSGKKPPLLRLLVLSRNLTLDRSWDLAVSVDGAVMKSGGNSDERLVTFLRSLPTNAKHKPLIDDLCESLRAVAWTLPDGFNHLSMLPGHARTGTRSAAVPIELDGGIDELLVVSPFLDADPKSLLQDLGSRTRGTKTLISRADTLNAIGPDALSEWTTLSLSALVVDGEDRLQEEFPERQELHAKLVVARVGSRAIWHIGSANMTNAAFGQPSHGVLPRNQEFMLRLAGKQSKCGPAKLLEEWAPSRVFELHVFDSCERVAPESNTAFRRVVHQLASAAWSLHAEQVGSDKFSVELTVAPLPRLPEGYSATVGLLCRAATKPLGSSLVWADVSLTDLSAFVPVEVTSESDGLIQRFAIQATFSVDLMDKRKRAILKETVGSSEKLLRYLALLLDAEATKSKWFKADADVEGQVTDMFGLDGRGALYEQLLRAAARSPERLSRALRVFGRVQQEDIELPAGLEELFNGFAAFGTVAK